MDKSANFARKKHLTGNDRTGLSQSPTEREEETDSVTEPTGEEFRTTIAMEPNKVKFETSCTVKSD
jgi:hypothetical protein